MTDKGIVESEDTVTLSIELVREHSGSMRDAGKAPNGLGRYVATPPHSERVPYKCGCTTCGGHFVIERAVCSGGCSCELVAENGKVLQ